LEDLVHEITNVGPHFKEATRFLWPFKLTRPAGTFTHNALHESGIGSSGFRSDAIGDLVSKMM
jgi:large subunit ribosomal protein L7e